MLNVFLRRVTEDKDVIDVCPRAMVEPTLRKLVIHNTLEFSGRILQPVRHPRVHHKLIAHPIRSFGLIFRHNGDLQEALPQIQF